MAVTVGLTLVARAAEPLRIVIDINEPTAEDVNVVVEADGIRASVLQKVGGIDQEIARLVARFISSELSKPHIVSARDIDVAARIGGAMTRKPD